MRNRQEQKAAILAAINAHEDAIFDRDAAEQAWFDKLQDAAIALEIKRQATAHNRRLQRRDTIAKA